MEQAIDVFHQFWPLLLGVAGIVGLIIADDHRHRSLEARRTEGITAYRRNIRTSVAIASSSTLAIAGAAAAGANIYF
ncbi:hypothetical protein ACPW96_21575 [Micromonospora sp. DT81.3]|uniref:hypothetical protein n=1 Tax=Micromonospora sp. DT81.3 TaxID=3416523 RepID=UPI003CEE7DC5